ncbi:MAG: hypothetical protein LAT64_07610 [Phycisphaerales bacterium]|nr:hypothetical protein [Planctomycetota bacterium]MCH8508623.1 hypothetical protein [Phycisphaerales bacterium]
MPTDRSHRKQHPEQAGEQAAGPSTEFQAEVPAAVGGLRRAILAAMKLEGSAPVPAPAELSRDLGLDNKLGWKLHWLLSNEDPFSAGLFVPGRAGVGLIAEGLRHAGADEARVAGVSRAGEAFQRCVTRHAENRAGFDTLLAAHTRDGRSALDHRRLAYQGARYIWGIESRVNVMGCLVHPSEGGDMMDVASVRGIMGCQRLREHVPWRVGRTTMRRPEGVHSEFKREPLDPGLEGMPVGDGLPVMRDYCSDPLPRIDRVPGHGAVEFQLGPGAVGRRGRFDLVTGEVVRSMQPRYAEPGDPPLRVRFAVRIPTQQVVFDVLMHKEMFGGAAPRVSVLSDLFTSDQGAHQPADELPHPPDLEVLGTTPGDLEVDEAPRYAEAMEEAMSVLGWAPESFDAFRVTLAYPPVPTTIVMTFDSEAAQRG